MNILIKYSSFLAVLCMFDGANADIRAGAPRTTSATSPRVSLAIKPTQGAMQARRIPTMTKTITTTATTTTATTSSSSLLSQQECIEQYTDCIHDTNACGGDFEECTTKPLFYTKKPQCNSVLLQCGTDGIYALFGTSDTTAFANKDSNENFVYPTDGSILGQFIEAGHIANLLDKSQCVKRVTSCLKKDSVCGENFELCTSNSEFKKQKVFCEAMIARCQNDGIVELFGPHANVASNPESGSRLAIMISEGSDLAAVNAVSTCYKVADQCILSTCNANPYKCITDSSLNVADIVDAIKNDKKVKETDKDAAIADARTSAMVNSFIRGACMDTIGGNKYCHMTVNEGKVPSAADLIDEFERENVYDDIYASRMNAAMRSKIQDFANEFDAAAKEKCVDTVMACAMRSCGSGVGSMCYKKVFGNNCDSKQIGSGSSSAILSALNRSSCSINAASTYGEIKRGCEAIVNTDANCQYAAQVGKTEGYNYSYSSSDTFGTVFPQFGKDDIIGAVSRLNAALASNYNDAAIAALAKQCRTTAVSCIKSMCGSDYVNCYRNRTDIVSDTYKTDNEKFNNSMNKVGGVLDFNIVRGLCVETVKNTNACEEHLKISSVRYMKSDDTVAGWGDSKDVRTAWNDAVKTGYGQGENYSEHKSDEILEGCMVKTAQAGTPCYSKLNNTMFVEDCGYVDEDGCVYDLPHYITETDYAFSMASDTLFQEVLGDIEKEAQAKYNAKLTKEQNMCVGGNNGGLMGARDMSSTYMWVKLKSKRIPKNYSTAGLGVNDFTASNDLYGSFCRARVTIQSDDPDVQTALQKKNQNWSTAYFAVGDVFTCGSWIPQDKLQEIASMFACKKAKKEGTIKPDFDCTGSTGVSDVGLTNGQKWAVAGTAILSTGVGAGAMELLQSKTGLGGLMGSSASTIDTCRSEFDLMISNLRSQMNNQNNMVGEGDAKCHRLKWKGKGAIRKSNFGQSFQKKELVADQNGCVKDDEISSVIDEAEGKKEEICGKDDKASIGKRLLTDGIGAAAVALPTTFAVRDAIRNGNRAKFTADEEAFMREVGDHIYCFIGANEAGNYGDLVEISVDE